MNALVDVTWIRQAENIAYAPLKIIHLTDSAIPPLTISNCKMSNKWGKSTSVFHYLWRHFGDRFLQHLFDYSGLTLMMSLTSNDAVTSLSVCHHFPGSSRVRLCSRPQGTEGLSTLSLGVLPSTCLSHTFSSVWTKQSSELVFPGYPRFSGSWGVSWGAREAWTARPTRSRKARPSGECVF